MADTQVQFAPDRLSPPGDTIADVLEERGWSQAEFAQRIDYAPKHVNQLLRGKWIHGGLLQAGTALL